MPLGHGMDRISEFELFTEGDDLYASMVAAIESAERDVRMESYILAADEVGRRFAAALAARARAGADVRLHLDQYGADSPAFRNLRRELEAADVSFRWYHPLRWRHPLEYLQRNHRKLLVVDDRLTQFACALRRNAAAGHARPRNGRAGSRGGGIAERANAASMRWAAPCGAFSEPCAGMPKEARKVIGDVTRHIEDEAD